MIDSQVIAFAVVAAVMTMIPGADTILVVRNTLRGGGRDGLVTMLGIGCGLYFHATLSALGVSAVLLHSARAFAALKVAGAFYLAWLGIQSLRAAGRPAAPLSSADPAPAEAAAARSFREGILTNLLNPKVLVFYLALLPQFIAAGDPVFAKSLLLAAIHFAEGILWFCGVVWAVERSRRFFVAPAVRRWLDGICGGLLVALGLRLALDRS